MHYYFQEPLIDTSTKNYLFRTFKIGVWGDDFTGDYILVYDTETANN